MELKRWEVCILEKNNVLRFNLHESREGFRHQHDISCAGLYIMDMSYKYHCFSMFALATSCVRACDADTFCEW